MPEMRIYRQAERDFEKATRWYFKRSPVTAYRFGDAFHSALKAIESDALHFGLIDKRHRSLLMKPFSYQIIFRVEKTWIEIIAVAHTKRKSGFWKRRTN